MLKSVSGWGGCWEGIGGRDGEGVFAGAFYTMERRPKNGSPT
ncbi:hypothetical protein HMPREF1548_03903 [Clostridium sp. KLE 1755]|nr:hypothetical protein HMPREF1548_03903 [Clostridium sp. KLE 1755]